MSPADWERIKQTFSAALNVPAAQRDAYLEGVCPDRADIRAAVDELLRAHHDASQSFLEPHSIVVKAAWLLQAGDTVAGRFRVVRPIARGAMGEVYEVDDERLRLKVALKAIRPELVGDPDTAERFRREVLVTRDIAHEGLCRVFDLVEHTLPPRSGFPDGTVVPCLTMQLLEGTTLEDALSDRRPLSTGDALPVVHQIAEALQVLHDAGVVHRDLKPSNVMLVASEAGTRAVLTDFGLARPLEEGLFETRGAVQGGAPYFMAPELLRGGRPSPASDIYALGLLIDEMVTRERAFSADSLHALLLQKLGDGPARPSDRADGLPRQWESTILRCVAPDPRDRFSCVTAAIQALVRSRPPWQQMLGLDRVFSMYLPRRWRLAVYAAATAVTFMGAGALAAPTVVSTPSSVAILPFSNLTGHDENDYVAIGTVAELRRRLSRIRGWHVYTPDDAAARIDPGQALFSLRGQVRQAGTSFRITAELVDTREGTLLWSQTFEGTREEVLTLEDRLAGDALGALTMASARGARGGTLSRMAAIVASAIGWRPRLPPQGTSSNEAFDAYMRGRYLSEERTLSTALAAIELFQRSVSLDPGFAAPYAGLADVQSVLMDLHHAPHDRLLGVRERYATQAVALDPNLPEAHLSLAAVRQAQSRWEEAEDAYRQALDLHPTFARAYRWYGGMLLQFGRFDEALKLCERALELDPYDVPNHSAYGLVLFYAGRPLDAARHLETLLDTKDHVHAHLILGQVYSQLAALVPSGREEYLRKALRESEILRKQNTAATARYADLVAALAWSYQNEAAAAERFLQPLESGRAERRVSPSFAARVYAVQNRPADALDALEAAEAERDRELMYLAVSPLYDSVRNEPRFRALLARLQLVR